MHADDHGRDLAPDTRAGGFRDGFETWYAAEHDRMVAALVLTSGNLDVATEGVDEAFSRALEHWERVRVMDSPTGWVYRVALNRIHRVARRQNVERI